MGIAAALFLLSAWGSGISDASAEFIIYRIIGGLAVGGASVICPAYISEIAPSHIRGSLATLQQMAIISGLFTSFLSNYVIANTAGSSLDVWLGGFEAWRWMFWAEIIPATAFGLLLMTIPESPRFLAASGREDLASIVLKELEKKIRPKNLKRLKRPSKTISRPLLAIVSIQFIC